MKLGVLKEGKIPPDERVPLSPEQCVEISKKYPDINLVVQSSNVRRYKDEEYINLGIKVVDSVEDCDILIGVKEVPIKDLIENKTYFYFSHTIKKQPYNRNLLLEMLNKNITMIDWETLTNNKGVRLIGFGKYAGIVGCYNTFYAYGKRTGAYQIKRAYLCEDRAEMEAELPKVKLPNNYKIVMTGGGRVATGIIEILEKLNIQKVSAKDILTNTYSEPVYTQLLVDDYYKKPDGSPFKRSEVYSHPERFVSDFMKFAKVADMYISGHFWDEDAPYIFSREDAKSPDFNIKVVGDVSCDIDGPVACTLRPSTIIEPIYGYNPQSESETNFDNKDAITVMAVDNLPCELPKDASSDFGREFIDKVLPHLINDSEKVIERATICKNGNLMPDYEYLRDYVNGTISA
ncbi:MAG: alanine dehydrogenase [Flavobacteriales bacterium]|nr:alanine dehydrogenase [Flavobacteriales bacterium]